MEHETYTIRWSRLKGEQKVIETTKVYNGWITSIDTIGGYENLYLLPDRSRINMDLVKPLYKYIKQDSDWYGKQATITCIVSDEKTGALVEDVVYLTGNLKVDHLGLIVVDKERFSNRLYQQAGKYCILYVKYSKEMVYANKPRNQGDDSKMPEYFDPYADNSN